MSRWTYYIWIALGCLLFTYHSVIDANVRLIVDSMIILGCCICLEIKDK